MRTKLTFWSLGTTIGSGRRGDCDSNPDGPHGTQVVERSNSNVNRPLDRGTDRDVNRTHRDMNHAHNTCKASDVDGIGMNVRGLNGEDNIGSINDLVIGHDGRVEFAAVSFGGFLGIGDKLFTMPFESIDFVKTDDDAYAHRRATEETLKEKKGFNQDDWPSQTPIARSRVPTAPPGRDAERIAVVSSDVKYLD